MSEKLKYSTLPKEIRDIANDALGLGVLKSLFKYSYTYHLMIKLWDGEFVGFALYHFEKERNEKGRIQKIGVIDCICVSHAHRHKGFGTLLTFGVIRKMSACSVSKVEFVFKTPRINKKNNNLKPITGNEELLYSLGFKKIDIYDNYYSETSLKYRYDCILCKKMPDICLAVLYRIDETGE